MGAGKERITHLHGLLVYATFLMAFFSSYVICFISTQFQQMKKHNH